MVVVLEWPGDGGFSHERVDDKYLMPASFHLPQPQMPVSSSTKSGPLLCFRSPEAHSTYEELR